MKTKYLQLIGFSFIFLMLFSTSINAQTPEQIKEVKRLEGKIYANRDNPNFDMKEALIYLYDLKKSYGLLTEEDKAKYDKYIKSNEVPRNAISVASEAGKEVNAGNESSAEAPKLKSDNNNVIAISQEEFNNASAEKQALIKSNPQKYQVISKSKDASKEVIIISKETFEKMSPERKKLILSQPERYSVAN